MDFVDFFDDNKEFRVVVRGKGFKSLGKLFIKKSIGDEGVEIVGL